ncbi:hypothetical protein N7462_000782 [Penicillium macrosclerotiorum]|uniref:uncharacterized protein n=1 Tax=Penicillium macrosclerotiorum TaxID=303699 RepID=UPI00254667F6|nr:uncharacterized protein N7462_000782 [Penicillium macrosclerotiorum]KAJ5698777.1 hypothetical protein N7462_000782 [Penicillium macrosclerotiorum]
MRLSLLAFRQLTRNRTVSVPRGFVTSTRWLHPGDSQMTNLLYKATEFNAIDPEQSNDQGGSFVEVHKLKHSSPDNQLDSTTHLEFVRPAQAWLHGDSIKLYSPTRGSLKRSYFYLRDLCQCPQCKDPHSKQRSFRTSDIPDNIQARSVRWDGGDLEIQWRNDIPGYDAEHTSRWNINFLKRPATLTHDHQSPNMKPMHWSGRSMDHLQHWVPYNDYMHDDATFTAAMRNLSRLGLIFVKDVPDSREMVEQIATRMGPLRNTFYGATWDVRTVPQAKNVAYTNQHLGFHMDLMYMNEPPGYQLLHCLQNSCEGGESLFADTFRAADIMKKQYPDEFRMLAQRHFSFEYAHKEHKYHNTRPLFDLDAKTKKIRYVNYSPPFQGPLPHYGTKDTEGAVGPRSLKLNPGECVIFNNRRVVHARNKFNTLEGSRWLAGAYVDEDALLSKYAVSSKAHWLTWKASDPYKFHHQKKKDFAATGSNSTAARLTDENAPLGFAADDYAGASR